MRYLATALLLLATSFVFAVIDARVSTPAVAFSASWYDGPIFTGGPYGIGGGYRSGGYDGFNGTINITITNPRLPFLCPGDCNEDGRVTVDELVTGIAIAMNRAPAAECPMLTQPANVAAVVQAVSNALRGCSY